MEGIGNKVASYRMMMVIYLYADMTPMENRPIRENLVLGKPSARLIGSLNGDLAGASAGARYAFLPCGTSFDGTAVAPPLKIGSISNCFHELRAG